MTHNDTFNEYGYDFQIKAIASIFSDKYFLSQIVDVLDSKYFETPSIQYLSNLIVSHYREYKDTPTASIIAVEIGNLNNEELKTEAKLSMMNVGKVMGSKDLPYIKESIIRFCKKQEMKKAIIESVDLISTGEDYEGIYKKIGDALTVGMDTNIGHEYHPDFEERYEIDYHSPIPTPWEVVNSYTKGGPGAGHLCLVMAGPGVGKSWMLAAIGARAMQEGKTVLHYTMELSDVYVGRRYDTILSGIHIDELDDKKEEVRAKVKSVGGKLIVRSYFSNYISSIGLQGHIEKCARVDIKPDIIIVDYADLMKLSGKGELRHQIENLYQDLRRISGEYACPVWTASQLNRNGSTEDYADGNSAAEAFSKNNTPDLIMSISRPPRLREQNILFGFIIKNRLGPDKIKLTGQMDTDYGKLELFDSTSDAARSILLASTVNSQNEDKTRTVQAFVDHKNKENSFNLG